MARIEKGRTIAPQSYADPMVKAVAILRDRNTKSKSIYTEQEIQRAVDMVRQWEPDHPCLRYHERRMPVSKLVK